VERDGRAVTAGDRASRDQHRCAPGAEILTENVGARRRCESGQQDGEGARAQCERDIWMKSQISLWIWRALPESALSAGAVAAGVGPPDAPSSRAIEF
jgi:hypothetical protein